jgi:hypothetical protein
VTSGLQLLPGLKVASRVTAVISGGVHGPQRGDHVHQRRAQHQRIRARQDNRGYVNVLSVRDGRWTGWRSLGDQTLASDLSPVQFGP